MTKKKKYGGVIIPMITPFTEDGKIDHSATLKIVEYLVENKTIPFVLGTTGESASIPDSYRPEFVETVLKTVGGREKTYAGISGNSLATSVDMAKRFFDLGVDVVVAHLPSYYPLTNDQILKYFENLVEKIPGPLVIYNIPSTTHLSIPLDVIDKLSHNPKIVAVKDSERNIERLDESLKLWANRTDFSHFLGWNQQITHAFLHGSDGCVPSTGNLVPRLFYDLYEAAQNGDDRRALELQDISNVISSVYQKDLVHSEQIAAIKVMMNALDLCNPHVLPPLQRLEQGKEQEILTNMHLYDKYFAKSKIQVDT